MLCPTQEIAISAPSVSLIGMRQVGKTNIFVLHRGKRAYLSSAGHVCLPFEMIY